MRKNQELFDKTLFCLGVGSFLLLIWFLWREPMKIAEISQKAAPHEQMYIYFFDKGLLVIGIGLLIIGLAGFIKLTFFNRK